MSEDNIVDASKPSAGRMYDYFLGGNHNFEVDRQAADQILQLLPFVSKVMRLQRWPLQDIAEELSGARGFDVIIDFASGLPTNDHLHLKVKPGTTVIYSDYDPVVVEYTHEILKDTPNTHFFQSDARRPEDLLNRPEVQKILGGRRKVAFVLWGVSLFLKDEDISHLAKFLYDWSAPGSCLVFNAQGAEMNLQDPDMIKAMNIYAQMGSPLIIRTLAQYHKLLEPWKLEGKEFIPLLEWNGFEQSEMGKDDLRSFGPMGGGSGGYLGK
jgi:hypothetical protein